MKKVLMIATGGTIASDTNEESGKLASGVLTGEEIIEKCDIPVDIEVKVDSFFQKASMHLNFSDLIKIKEELDNYLNEEAFDGIVITQGTDTLEEASYFMHLISNYNIPIVFTGSQRSPQEVGTDSFINIKNAILAACSEDLKDVGVTVVFNERIFHSRYVRKEHASNIQGFNAFGYGYLGIIDNNNVRVFQKPTYREYLELKRELPAVDIIKVYMDADGKYIQAAIDSGVKGLILEGVGRGQVSRTMMPVVKECIKQGIAVVITTSAVEGEVYPTYDYEGSTYDLMENGVLLGKDYDSKKARIKLLVGLASNVELEHLFDI
ncbi:asparaginase [Oceanobacillus neutriphilus]|uniref:asparaginase n=1 Tax=Oceanobacillus neutriphilus TaxID=531815 RepID=A0ABQ2NTX6_9BACI|nr:asparaginase [Oceanobacillus neutriphilus]GGP10439.1 L-asparaginase [Oceanobacillus neutriphilus]